jgi:plastocyanin
MPDGWRMIFGMQTGRMVGTDPELKGGRHGSPNWKRSSRWSPRRPVADPAAGRKNLAVEAGIVHAPGDQTRKEHSMTIDATSAQRRPGADADLSTQGRRRRPRWWLVLLAVVAAAVVATVVVIQLLPNAADGPPVVGATQVAMRDSRFDPPVIQIKPGQTVTWSFNDGGVTHNVKGSGWGSGDQASGTFQHTFTAPGSYRYSCTLHLGMNGRVDVGPGATP